MNLSLGLQKRIKDLKSLKEKGPDQPSCSEKDLDLWNRQQTECLLSFGAKLRAFKSETSPEVQKELKQYASELREQLREHEEAAKGIRLELQTLVDLCDHEGEWPDTCSYCGADLSDD